MPSSILAQAPRRGSTIAVNSAGKAWTESGFRASGRKLKFSLEKDGRVTVGLTFHGLRHSVATSLRKSGIAPRIIADTLGQKTEGYGLHYSRAADLSEEMAGVVDPMTDAEASARERFDKHQVVKLSNSAENASFKPA